jgi:hypothetical protein
MAKRTIFDQRQPVRVLGISNIATTNVFWAYPRQIGQKEVRLFPERLARKPRHKVAVDSVEFPA